MKIIYVTSTFPYGAGEEFLRAEVLALSGSVDSILVVPLYPRGKIKDTWTETASVSSNGVGLLSAKVWIAFFSYCFFRPIRFFRALAFLLKHSRFNKKLLKNLVVFPKAAWLAALVSKNKIDHVHVHWGGATSSMVMLSCLLSGVGWSLTCHRWDIYENNLLGVKSRAAKFIRFISNRGATDSLKYGVDERRVSVIPMGVAIEGKPPVRKFNGGVLRVICAANLISVKGHKYLLEAAAILKKNGRNFRLSIAGTGPLFNDLRKMTVDLQLTQEVDFMGQVAHSKLMELYSGGAVDLFVLPSVELDPVNHEGVPVSLMEAMSFGIPCISTQTGSIQELLTDDFDCTVPQQDAAAIARKMELFMTDTDFYARVSRLGGEVLMSKWTSTSSAQALLDKVVYSL